MNCIMNNILVVGSTNVDMIARVHHLPVPGETVGDAQYCVAYGGKGANQAVAAAVSGHSHVEFVSFLGNDIYADKLICLFQKRGLSVEYIKKCPGSTTGVAFILVADNGENCIAVAPGANNLMQGKELSGIYPLVEKADVLMLQLEIPYATVLALIDYAVHVGTKVVLNPAPARQIPMELLAKVDVLILNETEATAIVGTSCSLETAANIARHLCVRRGQVIILTLGDKGAMVVVDGQDQELYIPAIPVHVVDTTGAGDTFCGAFVSRWIEQGDVLEACSFATAAAALSVTKYGAQSSIPDLVEVEDFLRRVEMGTVISDR